MRVMEYIYFTFIYRTGIFVKFTVSRYVAYVGIGISFILLDKTLYIMYLMQFVIVLLK